MPTMEQIEEGYFNYLANKIIESIKNADDYNCKDFDLLKLELIKNLNKILESKEKFNEAMMILHSNERGKLK